MKEIRINVAFVEDDPLEITAVERALKNPIEGFSFNLQTFEDPQQYLTALRDGLRSDVAILDVHFDGDPGTTGVLLARETRKKLPQSVILMRTNDSSVVKECLLGGANDFIYKRGNEGELAFRVVVTYKAKNDLGMPAKPGSADLSSSPRPNAIGASMSSVSRRIPSIVGSAVRAVHIHGESGTGKEVVADLFASEVKTGSPFVKVNCAAIAGGTMESELFGHVRGAFTGANTDRKGFIECADKGWLYLDEIAELTPKAQGALLRVLENGEFSRVGESRTRKVTIKIVSATNENIPDRVVKGTFRRDLWQRLCEAEITLPPLRERMNEIEELAKYFMQSVEGGPYEITLPALEILKACRWENGNIRELRNCIRAMTEHAVDGRLSPMSIPKRVWDEVGARNIEVSGNESKHLDDASQDAKLRNQAITVRWEGEMPTLKEMYDRVTLEYVRFIHRTRGRTSLRKLVEISGAARSTLSPKLKLCVEQGWATAREVKDLVDIDL